MVKKRAYDTPAAPRMARCGINNTPRGNRSRLNLDKNCKDLLPIHSDLVLALRRKLGMDAMVQSLSGL
jgi:hypothetical protein